MSDKIVPSDPSIYLTRSFRLLAAESAKWASSNRPEPERFKLREKHERKKWLQFREMARHYWVVRAHLLRKSREKNIKKLL